MRCPLCSNRRSRVVETVSNPQESSVRRVRECVACGHRWATCEAPGYTWGDPDLLRGSTARNARG